jgi:hypothetical protein
MTKNHSKRPQDDFKAHRATPAPPDAGADAQRTGLGAVEETDPPKRTNGMTVSELATLGGNARAASLTAERRSEIARKAGEKAQKNRRKRLKTQRLTNKHPESEDIG